MHIYSAYMCIHTYAHTQVNSPVTMHPQFIGRLITFFSVVGLSSSLRLVQLRGVPLAVVVVVLVVLVACLCGAAAAAMGSSLKYFKAACISCWRRVF